MVLVAYSKGSSKKSSLQHWPTGPMLPNGLLLPTHTGMVLGDEGKMDSVVRYQSLQFAQEGITSDFPAWFYFSNTLLTISVPDTF